MKNCCARRAGERCRDCGTSFIRMISPEMLQGPPGKDTMFDQEEEETGLTLSDDDVDSVVYGVLPLVDRGMQRWPDFQHGDTRDALCTAEGIEHSALLSSPLALSSLGGATDGRGTGSNTPGHKSFRSSFSSAETSPKSCRSLPSSLSPCSLSFLEVPHENGSWRTGEDDEVLEFPGDFGEDRRSIPIRHVKPPHCGKNTEHLPAAEVPRCLAPPHVLRAFARVWIKTDQRDNKQVQIDEEWSRREGEKNKDTCSTDGSSLQYGKNTPRTAGTRQNQVSGTIGKPDWLTQQALEGEPFNPLLNRNVEHLHSCSEGNHLKDTPGGGETEDDAGCTTIPDDEEEGIDVLPPIASDILKQPSYSPFSFFPSSLSSVSSFRHSSMEPITSRRSVSLATSASGEYGPVSKPTDSYLYEKTTSTAFPSPPGCLLSSTPSFVSYSSPLAVPSSSSCSPVTPTPLARVGKSFSREETFPQLGKAA
ncbi:hypothetical protein CSUI_002033 [Cystoisospora suis]|uniref:Uncharacterized protein n=1 Tax=Cystoisospora suis TaxID=483139 RepID=A0A2C6LAB4_9APIC|nr:hypothetical protein CSUI_002033 [Cystoisospora suis]